MNPYQKLVSTTFIFGLGMFSSKALVFMMLPIYTRVLSSGEYGTVDLIVNTCNLLMPVVSAGIAGAVVRFGLEQSADKKAVFTIGITVNIMGMLLLPLLWPVLSRLEFADGYEAYICAYIIVACFRAICGQFVRAIGYIKLYAADGLMRTVFMIGLNILLIVVFPFGIAGYLAAGILSDLLSAVILTFCAKLTRYFDLNSLDKRMLRSMLRYCAPLIPTTISVWIINMSNRYMIAHFWGSEANGLYAVAYKIPTLIIIVASIFMDAWQISAVRAGGSKAKSHFFSSVLNVYQSLICMVSVTVILLSKPSIQLLTTPAYYDAWRYIPILSMATVLTCFSMFLGSIYMTEKKSVSTLVTTVIGAAVNITLNLLLIPRIGVQGAAVAVLGSYLVILVVRAAHTRKFIALRWNIPKLLGNLILMVSQCFIMLSETENWPFYGMALLAASLVLNMPALLASLKKLL